MGWPIQESAGERRVGGKRTANNKVESETNGPNPRQSASGKSREKTSNPDFLEEITASLQESRREWDQRLGAIQSDRRRRHGPLDPDFAEQATQRQNDATLDSLDTRGRQEIEAIDRALARIEAGTFGACLGCAKRIALRRLRAYPTADRCLGCARAASRA